MLKKILSVSGKPGLHKLISTGKSLTVVESLSDEKRFPVYPHDKVVSLGDIAIYTDAEEVPLKEVLTKIKEKEAGKEIDVKTLVSNRNLFDYFTEILPNFDREKVYASDLKKLFNWYNILVQKSINFEQEENEQPLENQAKEATVNE